MKERRKDKNGRILKIGETQQSNGSYQYCRMVKGKKYTLYASTLDILREKEASLLIPPVEELSKTGEIRTVNDAYKLWVELKKGLKPNTFENYKYMYESYAKNSIGRLYLSEVKKTDIRRFYNKLADQYHMRAGTIDHIHTVLHQVLDLAVDDGYIPSNPADKALTELKRSHNCDGEKRRALSQKEEREFLEFVRNSDQYRHWHPLFAVMLGTGMRVGEVTGLTWSDLDIQNRTITIKRTLVYYSRGHKCEYRINTPKTSSSNRIIPMLNYVYESIIEERKRQEDEELSCNTSIDGYTNFVFLNRYGDVLNYSVINKAIARIIRDYNDIAMDNGKSDLLPKFSCHTLRHTFATRLCESGMNVRVIQDILGHADFQTTMNIYVDVTKNLRKDAIEQFEAYLKSSSGK